MNGRPYVVQRDFTYLQERGVFRYPSWVPSIEDATLMTPGGAARCAAAHGGQAVVAEMRVFAPAVEPEPVATFTPPTMPALDDAADSIQAPWSPFSGAG